MKSIFCALALLTLGSGVAAQAPSAAARQAADYALATYGEAMVETLGDLLAFETVHREGLANEQNPAFTAMTTYLRQKAEAVGFDFADFGAVVVVGLGEGSKRLGVITHGDVQPADSSKWAASPFSLDRLSEPDLLVGRGVEDDKGPIATAFYAMKAVKDRGISLERRIELIISYTEESDWDPFQEFLAAHPPPELNVALDAEYPVVVAEKGWGEIDLTVPPMEREVRLTAVNPLLVSFTGGSFLSQVPEDAVAVIKDRNPSLETRLLAAARLDPEVEFHFIPSPGYLRIEAHGKSAHSSVPWEGRNAITHLAALLGVHPWPDGQAPRMVKVINGLVGTGFYGENFGDLAYEHPFMGPLTLSLGTLKEEDGRLVARINIRRPAGRSRQQVETSIEEVFKAFKQTSGLELVELEHRISDPHFPESPPQVPVLLEIFEHFTGRSGAQPLAIGGGTHARLVPYGVNFGPALPGEPYTGHSEHEYMSREQLLLNLKMYTAMLVELAGRRE